MLDEDTSSIVIGADNNQVSINIKQLKTVSDLMIEGEFPIELNRMNHNHWYIHRY